MVFIFVLTVVCLSAFWPWYAMAKVQCCKWPLASVACVCHVVSFSTTNSQQRPDHAGMTKQIAQPAVWVVIALQRLLIIRLAASIL